MKTNENCAGYRSLAQTKMDSILSAMSAMLNGNDFSGVASSASSEIAAWLTSEEFTYAQKASVQILQIFVQRLTELSIDSAPLDAYISIQEETLDAIRKMESFVPEEQREEFREIVASTENQKESKQEFLSHLKVDSKKHLTFSDTIALLNILLVIFFGIIQSMPSKQMERMIEQGDIQIAQNETIIQNQERILEQGADETLPETLNVLKDSIHLLIDEIEFLRDELKSSNEVVDRAGQSDSKDGKQQNIDAQD